MKKAKKICLLLLIISIGITAGCSNKKESKKEPQISRIRSICNLATLETFYHNVAEIKKEKGGIFQRDRVLWIEYTGVAKIGIDMSKVDMKIKGNNIVVTLPEAKLLSIDVGSIDKDSYYYSEDNKTLFTNSFTAEDETKAIKKAQDKMKKSVQENNALLKNAQDRAQDLIEKYIKQLGTISGTEYNISWKYLDSTK